MAGSKVSNFALGDSNIQSVMLTLDKTFKGQHQVSLTNYNTTAESQVAAGSVIEIGGALYKFDSNESITGSPSDGTVYIMAVPSGDSVTCAYTNTAPTWSDSKQGWYGTGATANNRYLDYALNKNSSAWNLKDRLSIDCYNRKNENLLYYASGSQVITATNTIIQFPAKSYDIGTSYNTTTHKYIVPEDGTYVINHNFSLSSVATGTVVLVAGAIFSLVTNLAGIVSASNTLFLRKNSEVFLQTAGGFSGSITVSSSFYLGIKKIT
jgi:hypothetical protein